MSEISRSALFGKLNSLCFNAMDSATVFCKMRGNPYVELVHWLSQMLQLQDSDLHRIVGHFQIDLSKLAKDLVAALDRLPGDRPAAWICLPRWKKRSSAAGCMGVLCLVNPRCGPAISCSEL